MSVDVVKYWPMVVAGVAVISSAAIAQSQISAHAADLEDHSASIDENEDAIEQIQRLLIRRQGEVELQVQRIENEQREQGEDLQEILRLLRSESE